jgi:hypothetical protein
MNLDGTSQSLLVKENRTKRELVKKFLSMPQGLSKSFRLLILSS